MTFEYYASGMFYEIQVTHYHYYPPSGRPLALCETPDEAYGDEEFEFDAVGTETRLEMDDQWKSEHYADVLTKYLKELENDRYYGI